MNKTLKLYAAGLKYHQIEERLGTITVDGVSKRLQKIRRKFGVSNRAQLFARAKEEGII